MSEVFIGRKREVDRDGWQRAVGGDDGRKGAPGGCVVETDPISP